VQVEEVPQTHTLLRQRFDKTSPPQGSDVPHLHVFRPTQVSVVKVHAGLQRAKAKKTENSKYSNLFCDIMNAALFNIMNIQYLQTQVPPEHSSPVEHADTVSEHLQILLDASQ
jgi:hypothetical protein